MAYEAVHKTPNGPGDGRPTALEIIQNEGLTGRLVGKTILITGGTSGLGLENARALYTTGANIFITARHAEKVKEVAKSISPKDGPLVEAVETSLDSFTSIRAGASDFLSKSKNLNILICNAGVMVCPESRTEDGFETQFGINHLSHFLLFQLLKETMLNSSSPEFASRVVSLSSCGHRGGLVRSEDYNFDSEPYNPWAAYGQSKTANTYFANEIERRFGGHGLHGLSVHPGLIHTPLERHIAEDPLAQGFLANPVASSLYKSPEQGAATTVWAVVSKNWEGGGGRYLEDCSEAKPFDESSEVPLHASGYAPHAYDQKAAERLWTDSLKTVDGT